MASCNATERLVAALHALGRWSGVDDRLEALRQLVDYWHGPILPADGLSGAELFGLTLPRPLDWWYRWAGRRSSIMSGQNFFYEPGRSPWRFVQDGRLVFQIENQGCRYWSTLAGGDDPPVFSRESEHEPWEAENVTLSEHLITNCILEAVLCHARVRASAVHLSELKLNTIAERVPALSIGPWRWCDMHFHAGSGAFMIASPVGEENDSRVFSVFIGACREGALDFIEPMIDDDWESAEI